MGDWPSINSRLLTLSTQWMNSPSRKCGHAVRAGFHLAVFVIGVNQEEWHFQIYQIFAIINAIFDSYCNVCLLGSYSAHFRMLFY